MAFVVLPATIPDIEEVYDVYFEAFKDELVTEILFPWDVTDKEFRSGHTKHTLDYWHKDALQYTYKCIDVESGKIVGMSLWDVNWKEKDASKRELPPVDWLQGDQKERAQEFIRAFWERKEEAIGGKKHVCELPSVPRLRADIAQDCHVVAVRPEYQRRGIGKLLTQPGIDISEQLQVPVYLEATDRAVGLYKKLRFETLAPGVVLKAEVVGKEESLEAPIMARMPKSHKLKSFQDW